MILALPALGVCQGFAQSSECDMLVLQLKDRLPRNANGRIEDATGETYDRSARRLDGLDSRGVVQGESGDARGVEGIRSAWIERNRNLAEAETRLVEIADHVDARNREFVNRFGPDGPSGPRGEPPSPFRDAGEVRNSLDDIDRFGEPDTSDLAASVEGRVTLNDDGTVSINGRGGLAVDADEIKVPLADGTIVTAREMFERQAERAKAIDDFMACTLGVAA